MTKKTQGKRPRPPKRRRRAPPPSRPAAGPTLVTPEGDPLVFARARYRLADTPGGQQAAAEEIAQILSHALDFDAGEEAEPEPGGAWQFPWYETASKAAPLAEPMQRRILAMVTLTADALEVETMSQQRMARCRRRLEDLLGARIHLVETTAQTAAEALAEPPPEDEPEPLVLPPEVIAEMEDRMLRQWLEESIPALDGMTPRAAARTPEGREMLEDLLAYIERQQARVRRAPGMFSPDYRKAKKMLGLE